MTVKVLHLLPGLTLGGTESQLERLLPHLAARGIHSAVASLKGRGEMAAAIEDGGTPIEALDLSHPGQIGRAIQKIRALMTRHNADILSTWLTAANVAGRLAARGTDIPVVSGLRVVEGEKRHHLWLEMASWRLSRIITVNSRSLRRFAEDKIGIAGERLRLVPNGIDPAEMSHTSGADGWRERWCRPGIPTYGFMGRLDRQKGVDVLLGALEILARGKGPFRCLIAGDGPLKTALEAEAGRRGLADRVFFLGQVRDRAGFLSVLDIFVLPSLWEGFPNVLLEALLLERPVVATAVSGSEEIIEPGRTGLLVPPGEAPALAKAIREAEHRGEAESWGKRGRARVLARHDIARTADTLAGIYQSLAENGNENIQST